MSAVLAPKPILRYRDELTEAMTMLSEDPRTIFIGQAVCYPGQAAYPTFAKVPLEKRIELPVAEDFQVGLSFGIALEGYVPVSFFPRWDFLIRGANQIVNHLDKAKWLGWSPKVIIRTAVGWRKPYDQGPQHRQNYSDAFRLMCETIEVVELEEPEDIFPAYSLALARPGSTIIVERIPLYGS